MTDLSKEWIKNPEGNSHEAWVDLIYNPDKEGNYWIKAGVKFDGCIHLSTAHNTPFPKNGIREDDQDYFHICNIDEMIRLLTKLKEAAKKYFGEDWE